MKLTPYEKLSKKERRALDAKKRGSWNGLCPVTRKAESKKLYSRKRTDSREDPRGAGPVFLRGAVVS